MSKLRDCIHGHLARSCELCAAQNDHATACEQIDRLRAESERLRKALNTAMWAMRQPLDEWKGECERKALDEARAALAEVGR